VNCSQNQPLRLFATTTTVDQHSSGASSSASSFSFQEHTNHDEQRRPPPQLQMDEQMHDAPPSRQEILNFAHDVLWHTSPQQQRCPLGSMTSELWEDSIAAIAYSCLQSRQENAGGGGSGSGGGHDDFIVAADRILQRLIQEHATQSKASRSYTSALEQWKVSLCQAWLQALDSIPDHDDDTRFLVLQRAEQLWRQIHRGHIIMQQTRMRRKPSGVFIMGAVVDDGNDNASSNFALNDLFVNLVQAWLRLNTLPGTERAIQLLLWDEIPDLFQNNNDPVDDDDDATTTARHRQALIACYHTALQQYNAQLGVLHNSRQEQRATRQQRLVEWMEVLASGVAGWHDVKPNHDSLVLDESSLSSSSTSRTIPQQQPHDAAGDDVKNSFDVQSSFEAQVLIKNLMEKVQTAGPGDTEMIHQVIEEWKDLSLSSSSSFSSPTTASPPRPNRYLLSNLARALVDYFIRCDDAENASLWLSRVVIIQQRNNSNKDMEDTISFFERRTSAIIALWAQKAAASHTPEAPWRAQDLLTRLEEGKMLISKNQEQQEHQQAESVSSSISRSAVAGVDHRLYMAVANLWHTSNEPRGVQKAIQICLDRPAPASFHPELLHLAVKILASRAVVDTSSQPPPPVSSWEQASIRKALELFEKHHAELKVDATLVSLVHSLEHVPARTIQSSPSNNSEILQVAPIGLDHGVMPSPEACDLLFSTLEEPDQVVNMVLKVQNEVAKPRIYLYAQAVNHLFGILKKDKCTPLQRIVREMLDRIANGTISLENDKDGDGGGDDHANNGANQLRNLLTHITKKMYYWKRDGDCQRIIDAAESKLMTGMFEPSSLKGESLIPYGCYMDMIKVLAARGKRTELIATVRHLVKHYEAGYTSLLPNTSLFKHCMSIVGSSSSQVHGKDKAAAAAVNVKDQEAMLNQLVALYATSGKSPECKPTEDLFAMIMQEMLKSPCTEQDAVRAEALIDQMIFLQVEIEKGSICSLAFLVLLASGTERVFERSMSLYEKLKMSAATTGKGSKSTVDNKFLFNLVRVCSRCLEHERKQALPIALKAFGQMRERGVAGADKYAFFLQTIVKLIPHNDYASRRQREALLERIFYMACQDGCLNDEVTGFFKRHLSKDQRTRLFQLHGAATTTHVASGSK
jgi:hypothetical protein